MFQIPVPPSSTHCHLQVHSPIPGPGHTFTGPQTALSFPTLFPTPATPAPAASSSLVQSALQAAHRACPWGDPHRTSTSPATPRVWKLKFSASPERAHFSLEYSSSRLLCIHHFSPVSLKRTVLFFQVILIASHDQKPFTSFYILAGSRSL